MAERSHQSGSVLPHLFLLLPCAIYKLVERIWIFTPVKGGTARGESLAKGFVAFSGFLPSRIDFAVSCVDDRSSCGRSWLHKGILLLCLHQGHHSEWIHSRHHHLLLLLIRHHCHGIERWRSHLWKRHCHYYDIPTFAPWGVNHEPESKSRSGTHGPIWPICYCIFACIKKRVGVRCRKLERQAVRTSILTNNTRHRLFAPPPREFLGSEALQSAC